MATTTKDGPVTGTLKQKAKDEMVKTLNDKTIQNDC